MKFVFKRSLYSKVILIVESNISFFRKTIEQKTLNVYYTN